MITRIDALIIPPWSTYVLNQQWDHDVVLREFAFDPRLLDHIVINDVHFGHRHRTDEELLRSRRLLNFRFLGPGVSGPQRNAGRGFSKLVREAQTVAWELLEDEADPEAACKRAMPDGRLALHGTCLAGLMFIVSVSNHSSTPRSFEAQVMSEDP